MRGRSLAAALAAALAWAAAPSCATVGEPPASGPPAFTGVRKLALVRLGAADREPARPKDALDALAESLVSRGYEERRVAVGPGAAAELAPVERLYRSMDGRIGAAPPRARFGRRAEAAGATAIEAARVLGVDAIVTYHRFEDRPLAAFPDAPLGGGLFPRRPEPGFRRPGGALSLVDREGNATWFAWGAPGSELDPSEPVNAAEAIDMLLRTLAGEPDYEDSMR